MKRILFLTVAAVFIWAMTWGGAAAQKITAEDIIAKHLESIGKADDRTKMFNITAVGEVSYSQLNSSAAGGVGKAVFASEANKSLLAMTFGSSVYQGETIKFDGKTNFVGFSRPGIRSPFGDYVFKYDTMIKHGLIGGVLQKGWALMDPASHNVRVTYDGTKKIDGKEAYVLNYEPKKGADVRIKVYFDKDTFRHIRTEYMRTNAPGMGHNPNTSSQLAETHENMTEDFSDFKTEYGVTLPHTYKIKLYVEKPSQTYEGSYVVTFKDFYYNSKLDAGTFEASK